MRQFRLWTVLLVIAAACMAGRSQAQWTDGGWTPLVNNKSTSGYSYNGTSPGASAVAPSGGVYHAFIDIDYSDTMSANGVTYDTTITWQYYLYGSVTTASSYASRSQWPNGTASDGLSSSGSYTVGPTWETHQDTTVVHPGATITVNINVDAHALTSPPSSAATSSATLNGTYTP